MISPGTLNVTDVHVSVVIPVYNRERFIGEAIESVLAQHTRFPFEVIVSDDGSTDGSAGVARSFGSRVRVIEAGANRGAAAARNAGVREASGRLIAFLDSDDRMLPGRLQVQASFLDEHPEIGLVVAASVHEMGERPEDYFPNRGIHIPPGEWTVLSDWRPRIVRRFFGAPSTTMVRRSLLDRIGLYDERFATGEDRELLFRAASASPIGCYNAPLAWMRTSHGDRLGKSLQGALTKAALWDHLLATPDLTSEERGLLEEHLRTAVRTALSASAAHGMKGHQHDILRRYGHVLDPALRLRWHVAAALPAPLVRAAIQVNSLARKR